MSLLLIALAVVYILGAVFVAGIGFGDELDARNPEYGFVVWVALLWPYYLLREIVLGFYYAKFK
jgi:hypothetical protein